MKYVVWFNFGCSRYFLRLDGSASITPQPLELLEAKDLKKNCRGSEIGNYDEHMHAHRLWYNSVADLSVEFTTY